MRAVVLQEHGGIEGLLINDEYAEPRPGTGEVIVQVGACALNYHDLFTIRGMPNVRIPLPVVIGIDTAGTIAELGEDCSDWNVGDRVLIDPLDPAAGKLLGETQDGGLAGRVRVAVRQLIPIPDDVSIEHAAALPVAYGTVHRMMETRGMIRAREKVLILGAGGGVGTCCVQLAKLAGAEVIACASSAQKLERLGSLGADHLIDYSQSNFVEEVHRQFGKPRAWCGGGVDVVVNFTGGDTWVPSLRCLTNGGRLLTCGATAGFDPKTDLRFIWTYELAVIGSTGWQRSDLHAVLELLAAEAITPVIDRIYALSDAKAALSALQRRATFGKAIVTP